VHTSASLAFVTRDEPQKLNIPGGAYNFVPLNEAYLTGSLLGGSITALPKSMILT
jgi:hypothetical protein